MDAQDPLPQHGERPAKKAYSTPELADIGALAQIALGGAGSRPEIGNKSAIKHP